jgi:hypothetical protein
MLRPSRSLVAKPFCYARTRNNRTGSRRRARRKVTVNASRRICTGRDGAYSPGETWRAFSAAGHRDRLIQSEAGRSKTATTKKRLSQDEETGSARFTERENRTAAQAVANTFARGQKSTQARVARGRIAPGTIASGAFRRSATHESESFPRCEKSRTHPQAEALISFSLLTSHVSRITDPDLFPPPFFKVEEIAHRLDVGAIGNTKLFFPALQRWRRKIVPAELGAEIIPNENIAFV